MMRNSCKAVFVCVVCAIALAVLAFSVKAQNRSEPSFDSRKAKAKGVTAVTASAPLHSSGGTAPNISLPGVVIEALTGNTAIVNALQGNIGGGNDNTAVGNLALFSNSAGDNNTAVGASALSSNSSGDRNIAVGFFAGADLTTGDNNIDIGNSGVAGESNTIRIGTAITQTKTFIAGIRGVTTGSATGSNVLIDTNGQLGTVSSSRRYKEDIRDMGTASDRLLQLRPVTFRYKKPYDDGSKPLEYGLIAEEVAEVYPDLVVYNNAGEVESVQYHKLPAMLLNEVQKQHGLNQEQQAQIARLEAQNSELTMRLEALEQMMKERPYRTASVE
jgi:hypothetical protein